MQAWNSPPVRRLQRPASTPALELFDTASQSLQPAAPGSSQGVATLYVCGITPYDATHMGHANTYVSFDLLNRVWRDSGHRVNYVQNVTDVDDPLLERAAATGIDWVDLAERETQLFRDDMTALNVIAPEHYVGAVESIPLVIELIQRLEQRGAVYRVDDAEHPDLYFSCGADDEFGSLAHLPDAEALEIFRERGGDPDRPGKKHPLDCLLWLQQRPGEPGWDSPFGRGRPGWHIECTAIALALLGTGFDVQAGGSDLVFPHHEMCAAEGRVATGQPFARLYVHSGMVGLDGEKMSKSKGNLVLVSQLRERGEDPMAIRLALLANHYRSEWTWTSELLESARRRLALWREAVRLDSGLNAAPVVEAVRAALADDLDAPAALAAVDAWAGASTAIDSDDSEAPTLVAQVCDALLGVRL
ncbi:cysteine--1-D-myo-inosityl 2-amino-2-deoxy-alpha-D-glucopyranoside ligase [Microlunatus panaciterrae]|uniref:L-cysteine:1D-myo-inositol 2-amino-2-deoxy-alpha-D-glucopyranoside ligase n=1 Tax=Microlunatus panaciterrae TaxID=400768 RepID=A0ABS2RP38_9ACTN|nr:cysteine--1-D-myo-inosityl 2-amino-2-deoxy-alpha-D-glucopyranoside ligase [Microlunatus panaciterrae]MBM7800433.1 L-cysteine:1D-myo-inositol 2-amino-2-deoxy-alpha-D-glucopyranoside ligase [Microlunatus panaciterrae]